MNLKLNAKIPKLHNKFRILVKDAKSGEVVQEGFAYNLVLTDQLFKQLFVNYRTPYGLYYMQLGGGSGTPTATDTALFDYICQKDMVELSISITRALSEGNWMITLGETEYVGETFTEIGLVHRRYESSSYQNELLTHAMIEDSEGTPISIGPKTDTQIIEIYATAYIEMDEYLSSALGLKWKEVNCFNNFIVDEEHTDPRDLSFVFLPALVEKTMSKSVNETTRLIEGMMYRLLSTEGNAPYEVVSSTPPTTDVIRIDIPNYTAIDFPNSAIFPDMSFAEQQIGVGDGVKKFFSFESGHFIEGTEVVKIDGVVQSYPADYSRWQGARQRLEFTDYMYPGLTEHVEAFWRLNDTDSWVAMDTIMVPILEVNYDGSQLFESPGEVMIDFKRTVAIGIILYAFGTKYYTSTMSYALSDDGITWGEELESDSINGYISYSRNHRVQDPPLETRYIKIKSSSSKANFNFAIVGGGSVKFTTPPGLVEAEAVGTGDGLEVDFALDHTPLSIDAVYIDDVETIAYTLVDDTITFDVAPAVAEVITADYKYAAVVTASWDTDIPPKTSNFAYDASMIIDAN